MSRGCSTSTRVLPAPDAGEWHQHFSLSDAPNRYFTMSCGGYRYPFTQANQERAQ
jgi:hypothetical protein